MSQIGPILAASGSLGVMYAEKLVAGIRPDTFARLASPGGVAVKSNHPAFVFGHLALYPARVMTTLKLPAGATAYPTSYEALFKNGQECVDDPNGTIYPPMMELTECFGVAYKAAIAAVRTAPDDTFTQLNPAEGRMRELFPTIGAALNFYLGGHVQNHLGQVSAWRRMMGLPSV